jgi:hypothetical protein
VKTLSSSPSTTKKQKQKQKSFTAKSKMSSAGISLRVGKRLKDILFYNEPEK